MYQRIAARRMSATTKGALVLLAGLLAAPSALASTLACSGKADDENDFTAYYDGRDFTHIIFRDRKGGATTEVTLKFEGRNDDGKAVYKGDHPWTKKPVKIIVPKDLGPGKKVKLRWGEKDKNGKCEALAQPY